MLVLRSQPLLNTITWPSWPLQIKYQTTLEVSLWFVLQALECASICTICSPSTPPKGCPHIINPTRLNIRCVSCHHTTEFYLFLGLHFKHQLVNSHISFISVSERIFKLHISFTLLVGFMSFPPYRKILPTPLLRVLSMSPNEKFIDTLLKNTTQPTPMHLVL